MTNPAVVSIRSRLSQPPMLPAHIHRIDIVEQHNGSLLKVQDLNLAQRFLYRNNDMITIVTEQQHLVFRHSLNVHGLRVEARLTMLLSPDRFAPQTFLNTFCHDGVNQVTTGQLMAALRPHVQAAIADNLSFVDVSRVPKGAPVRNATRHARLADVCKLKGLHLYTDELVLDAVC
ncbi:MAG: hypothetical protein ACI4O7_02505 [Aristaeellaceae bacterium]